MEKALSTEIRFGFRDADMYVTSDPLAERGL